MTIIVWSMPAGRHSPGAVAERLHVETTAKRHRKTWGRGGQEAGGREC